MGDRNEAAEKLYESECAELGVTAEDMLSLVNPSREREEIDRAGAVASPGRAPMTEDHGSEEGGSEGAGQEEAQGELQPVTEEVLDEVMRLMKKRVGTAARKTAKKARKYYKKHKAAISRKVKKWKKSAAGKKWMKKYSKAKKRLGDILGKAKGKKRLHVAGQDLAGRLREELAEGQSDSMSRSDIDILESGAVIASIVADYFDDAELPEDAEAARKTSDNLVVTAEKHESAGKFSISDDEMVPAVKAVGVVIDHFEKMVEGAGPLAP